jgi:hypothetical protein
MAVDMGSHSCSGIPGLSPPYHHHQVLSQYSRHFHNLTTQKNTPVSPAFPKATTVKPSQRSFLRLYIDKHRCDTTIFLNFALNTLKNTNDLNTPPIVSTRKATPELTGEENKQTYMYLLNISGAKQNTCIGEKINIF